jgi:hypothetical protein
MKKKCLGFEEETIPPSKLATILKHNKNCENAAIRSRFEADCIVPGYEVMTKSIFLFLFILGLCNDTINSQDHIVSNDQ